MNRFNIIASLGLLAILAACSPSQNSTGSGNTPFVYQTTQEVQVDVNVRAAGAPVSGAPVVVYQNIATQSGTTAAGVRFQATDVNQDTEVARGLTDSNGSYLNKISLPADLTKVYIKVNYIGVISEPIEVSIANGTAKVSLDDQNVSQLKLIPTEPQFAGSASLQTLPAGTTFKYLGSYTTGSTGGLPKYFTTDNPISSTLLQTINATLPEGTPLPSHPTHKNYIARGAASNLQLDQAAQVWLTFVHEGAGYKNAIGYYTYDAANPPRTVADVKDKLIIAFPNSSYLNSGGGLKTGNRVQLKYFDPSLPTAQQWSTTFPANTSIGWFLVANAWNGTNVAELSPYQTVFSDQAINYQLYKNNSSMTVDKSAQTVLLMGDKDAQGNQTLLLGFEDILRYQGGDQDFNDSIYLVQANPATAVSQSAAVRDPENPDVLRNVSLQNVDNPQTQDADGDGVNDTFDDYPTDPTKAINSYYPAKNDYGTLLFEDLWPRKGDYDFNDVVVDYNVIHVTNASNKLVQIKAEFMLKALGGGYHNGLAFQTNLIPSQVSSVSYSWEKLGVTQSGQPPRYGAVSYASNGLESGQSKATVVVFEDGYDITPPSLAERPFYSNVASGEPYKTPGKVTVTLNLASPLDVGAAGLPPYNPFIIVNSVTYNNGVFTVQRSRGTEVHLAGYLPTDRANTALFGTQDDRSATNHYYMDAQNRPWALNLPTRFDYIQEILNASKGWVSLGQDLRGGYLKFDPWATSSGANYKDWYRDLTGYRDTSKIYTP